MKHKYPLILWHFLLQQVLSGKFVLRFVVGAPLTEERHVDAAWKLLQDEASKLFESL
jgi:tyrosine decarboxylase